MDLVAEMLDEQLATDYRSAFEPVRLRPRMIRRLSRLPGRGPQRGSRAGVAGWGPQRGSRAGVAGRVAGWSPNGMGQMADRLLSRLVDYPRWLRTYVRSDRLDLFHIIDHSYAHLVHQLPPDRTVVTCHDLDAFRSLFEPRAEPRWPLYRVMTRHILAGLRKAAHVTCDSGAVREELIARGVVSADRASVVPNGVHPSRSADPDPPADDAAAALLGPPSGPMVELLHVGSTIARKRIDLLLRMAAALDTDVPVRLIRVGGPLTKEQRTLADELGVTSRIVTLPFLTEPVLSAVYRRAALVLLPSEREGFGLPIVEALASGTPVVATDLLVLRETGGDAVTYCPLGDAAAWTRAIRMLIAERRDRPVAWRGRRQLGIQHAARFSWGEYARRMTEVYGRVLGRGQ
jgi:glycosyltransferase involved in cell wall biosynthesis